MSPVPHHASRPWNVVATTMADGTIYTFCHLKNFDGVLYKIAPNGTQTSQVLSAIPGNPCGFPIPDQTDEHMTVCIMPDAAGRLHVVGQMHNIPMRMIKQTNPGDMSSWTSEANDPAFPSGSIWCFPGFFTTSDGTLFLSIFRSDNSNATMNLAIYKYSPGATNWVKVGPDISQGGTSSASYGTFASLPFVDKNDNIHIFFNWHHNKSQPYDKPGPLLHLKSHDQCATWENMNEAKATLPLVGGAFGVANTGLDPFGQSAPMYMGGVCVDQNGYPYANLSSLGGGNQPVRWNGTAWENLTPLTAALGLTSWPGVTLVLWNGQVCQIGFRGVAPDIGRLQFIPLSVPGGPRLCPTGTLEAGWAPQYDIALNKRTGIVKCYVPNEDGSPRFFTHGESRRRAG